jgi:large subunit ribosomal protein L37Ae
MVIEKQFASIKRFGPRYGRKSKTKLAKIEAEQKRKQKCPYCHHDKVRWVSVGVWYCKKCCAKFTGKAYSVRKKIIVKEELEPEEVQEEKEAKEVGEDTSQEVKEDNKAKEEKKDGTI